MGCYSWFARPITDNEFQLMREWAELEANYFKDCDEFTLPYDKVINSIRHNVPFMRIAKTDIYWWNFGFGWNNPKLGENFSVLVLEGKLYVNLDANVDSAVPGCCEFRITCNYPHKVIHNKKQLRKYIRKKYFTLTEEQHKRLDVFWKAYPNGVMYWG